MSQAGSLVTSGGGGSGIITIDGDSGSVTGSVVTISGGTTGLTTTGSGSILDIVGTLDVANGGTGATTLTGVLIGNGTSAVTANPITQYDVLVGGAANAISSISPSTSGYVLTSNGVSANPSFQAISSGEIWTAITASQTLAVNNGYICVSPGGALSLLLPAVSAVGNIIEVTLDGSTSFTITQGAGQQIRIGNATTTAGVGGSIASTQQGDSVRMVCSVANLKWNVLSSMGNPTVT
jgi:hypothetical protein